MADFGNVQGVLAAVLAETAEIAGFERPDEVDPETGFRELGFDSLAAVELSVSLGRATGLELPVTLGFDHPTPAALAEYLWATLSGAGPGPADPAVAPDAAEDPIAIVGMGCRFPGGVRSPEELFALVAEQRDAVGPFPEDRGWPLRDLFNPDPGNPHTSYTREGGFMADADSFDTALFDIGPREAIAMDPQQRVLLETAWETFEHARIDPRRLRGTATGVFVGIATHDHYGRCARSVSADLEGYFGLGHAGSVASGRLAYEFGLKGPAYTVDTACSSSLASLHLACQALRRGECEMALVGGATVLATPETFVLFSRQRSLSPDGRCKAFAADADGTGFAEGVGLVLVERLGDARRRGHRVLALVRGSAVNQDGASSGLSAPHGPSQEAVIRRALADAGLAPAEVDVVEAHGTGTKLGDPIEAGALLSAYGGDRDGGRPLWLGSLKSNVGHAQAAAGVGGVIKTVMAMSHGLLPKTLHVGEPSPHVDWSRGPLRLLTEPTPWPRGKRPRRGAVSSFGISGTNAHVVLEEAPEEPAAPPRPAPGPSLPTPWLLSAATQESLCEQGRRLHDHVDRQDLDPLDVGHSLLTTRTRLEHRAVVIGVGREQLLAGARALAEGESAPGIVRGRARRPGPVAFVFPGQGTHWLGMAREMSAASAVFAERLGAATGALARHLDWSLEAVLRGEPGAASLDRVEVVQPALFAVMVSLAGLWREFGVTPDLVIGHSQGEIAAAHVAGALGLDDAARLVVQRSRALAAIAGRGGMLSVALPADELSARIGRWDGRLTIAAVNGPAATVVAGDLEALRELLAECEGEGAWAKLLPGDVPGHSPHVDAIREELLDGLRGLAAAGGEVGFVSTVTGGEIETSELGPEYWFANVRQTVRFADAVRAAAASGCRTFVEISPHPVLGVGLDSTLGAAGIDPEEATLVGSLRRDEGGLERFAAAVAELQVSGHEVDWSPLIDGARARQVDLPLYAFERRRYWMPERLSHDRGRGRDAIDHPLLETSIVLADGDERVFGGRLAPDAQPWLADHVVMGTALASGTVFVELALRAGREIGCEAVEELTLEAPLPLGDEEVELQVRIGGGDDEGRRTVAISSRPAGREEAAWTRHASGTLTQALPHSGAGAPAPLAGEGEDAEQIYAQLSARGISYGPAYRGLRRVWRGDRSLQAEVRAGEEAAPLAGNFEIHPAVLDAAFHGLADLLEAEPGHAWLPFSWRGVQVHRRGVDALRAQVRREEGGASLVATDQAGLPVVSVEAVVAREVSAAQLAAIAREEGLYAVRWRAAPAPAKHAGSDLVLLGDGLAGIEARHCEDLEALVREIRNGAPAPAWLLVEVGPARSGDLATDARAMAADGLELLQAWLAAPELGESRLVLVTRGAVAAAAADAPDPAAAAIWGLGRAARAEHPGRVHLVDIEPGASAEPAVAALLGGSESEAAVRDGRLLVPRLVRLGSGEEADAARLDPEGTVLVTAGTSGLGALIARHLVVGHGVRRLLLASRRGREAPLAPALQAELEELGAEVAIRACDVADRAAVEALLAAIDPRHPLTAVVHSAGVLDDGVLTSLGPDQLDRVLRPKVDGAAHLHELTAHLDLAAFVLFSSVAGTFGGAGQGNYSAANAFLDGLAEQRRAQGLPAVSLAWGLWAETTEMESRLDASHLRRLGRLGLAPIGNEYGLARFDAALVADAGAIAIPGFDLPALRRLAGSPGLSPVLAGLASPHSGASRAPVGQGVLVQRLSAADESSRAAVGLDFVREHAAMVLGHPSAADVDPQRTFKEQGFDSLGALELRSRLAEGAGLRLPTTLVFDHPTPAAVAEHLLGLVAAESSPAAALDEQIGRLEALLGNGLDEDQRERAIARLRTLVAAADSAEAAGSPAADPELSERLRTASPEQILELVNRDLLSG